MNDKKIIKLIFTALTPIFALCIGLVQKVWTKWGLNAIQVFLYMGYLAMIDKHIGSTKDNMESDLLIKKARMVIEMTFQTNIFPEQKHEVLSLNRVLALKEPYMNNPRRKRLCTQPRKPGVWSHTLHEL